MNQKKLAILDFDGTIVTSMNYIDEMLKKLLAKHGISPNDDMLREIKPKGFRDGASYIKKEYHLEASPEEIFKFMIDEVALIYRDKIQLKPLVFEFMEQLSKKGLKICLATANMRDFAEAAVKRTGADQFLDYIITIDELKTTKDSPEIFLHCAQRFHMEPKECMVFEDSLLACQVAKEAGFYVVGVRDDSNRGKEEAEMKEICDLFIDDFAQALQLMV